MTQKIQCSLQSTGFNISQSTREDGHNITTVVSSGASQPSDSQLAPELSAPVLAAKGFSQEDIRVIREAIDADPPLDEVEYSQNSDGLIVNEQERPILPVQIKQKGMEIYQYNNRYYRPAQAWEAIGVTKPPVWTRKDGGRYIPWPKFGEYGRLFGNYLCQIRDIEEVKKLNRVGIAQKMDIINRVQTIEEKAGIRFKEPADKLQQTQTTLSLQVRGQIWS